MLIEHQGVSPKVSDSAYIAPTAVLCGDVEVGPDCRILFGAVVVAEDAPIRIGHRTVIMDNAVVRSWPRFPVNLGDDVMIGSGAQVNGAVVEDFGFIALGAAIFPGARVGSHSIVRTNAVVHINSDLLPNRVVPEGWTAIGRPAQILPRGAEERTLFSSHGLNFTKTIFGEDLSEVGMKNYLDLFDAHRSDRAIPSD
jgi:carbonic anhydrase/acetyltransferase-like protein (isoleucine patch superfamily)